MKGPQKLELRSGGEHDNDFEKVRQRELKKGERRRQRGGGVVGEDTRFKTRIKRGEGGQRTVQAKGGKFPNTTKREEHGGGPRGGTTLLPLQATRMQVEKKCFHSPGKGGTGGSAKKGGLLIF